MGNKHLKCYSAHGLWGVGGVGVELAATGCWMLWSPNSVCAFGHMYPNSVFLGGEGGKITGRLMFKASQKERMDLPCYVDKASSFRRRWAAHFFCDVLVTLLASLRDMLSLLPVPGFNCPSLVWVLGLGQRPVLCDGTLQNEHPDSGSGLVHHGVKVSSTSCQSLRSLVCWWRLINWPSAVGIRVDVLDHTSRATLSSGFCEQGPPLGQQKSSEQSGGGGGPASG